MKTGRGKDLSRYLNVLRKDKAGMAKRFSVQSMAIFGYSRRQQTAKSDLDILVEFFNPPGLFQFMELADYLNDLLGVKVDLVIKDALKPNIGKHILDEIIPV